MNISCEENTKAHVTDIDYFAVTIICEAIVTDMTEVTTLLYKNDISVMHRCDCESSSINEELKLFNYWKYTLSCKDNVFTGKVLIKLRQSFKDSEKMQQGIEWLFSILKHKDFSLFEVSAIDIRRRYIHTAFADIMKGVNKNVDVNTVVSHILPQLPNILI